MKRILIGIIVGAFAAFACIFAIEYLDATLYPLPAGVDPNSSGGAATTIAVVPFAPQVLVVIGWCVGTLVGGGIAARLAHRRVAAWIVAAFVVTAAFETIAWIAHPAWMVASGLVLPWLCALLVQGLARRRAGH